MSKKKSVLVGGRESANLLHVERGIVLEHKSGRGFMSGVIRVNRKGTLYLLVPVKVRDALKLLGVDLQTLVGLKNKVIEATITFDEKEEELKLEYAFRKGKRRVE